MRTIETETCSTKWPVLSRCSAWLARRRSSGAHLNRNRPSVMLCRDAATLAAPIEQVGEGPTPAAIADFLFKQPGGHDARLAGGPRRYDRRRFQRSCDDSMTTSASPASGVGVRSRVSAAEAIRFRQRGSSRVVNYSSTIIWHHIAMPDEHHLILCQATENILSAVARRRQHRIAREGAIE